MITVWEDPDFDPELRAFYYARVIEIPTPRWTTYEAVRFEVDLPEQAARSLFKQVGLDVSVKTYCGVQCWGTPEQILEKLAWRRDLLGDFELNLIAYYGGMSPGVMEESVSLFAEEVLPELHRWGASG